LSQAPQTQSRRIVSIQVCRGLAALLVVLAHLHGIETRYCATNHLSLFEHGALGVDLFFVISGVVIASVTAGRFGHPRDAGIFLYRRLARIFPIFWIYTTLTLIAHHFDSLHSDHAKSINLLPSYLLIPTNLPMLLLQGWTLSYELYFYLAFFLLLLFVPERIAPWLLTLWGIAVVALKLQIGLSPFPLVQLLISPAVLEFLAGCIIFHIYRRSRLHPAAGIFLLAASVVGLAAITGYTIHIHSTAYWIIDQPWRRPLIYGTLTALFLLGAIELERTGLIRYFPFLASVGDWSYSIYLSHALVLGFIGALAVHLLPNHTSILLITLIGLPSVLLIGYFSYVYVERPLLNLLYKSGSPPQPTATPTFPQNSHTNPGTKSTFPV
jgi:exopolysaccharide production protein ExoZ